MGYTVIWPGYGGQANMMRPWAQPLALPMSAGDVRRLARLRRMPMGVGSVGLYRFCTVAAVYAGGSGGGAAVYPISGPNAYGQYDWYINGNPDTNYWIACYN